MLVKVSKGTIAYDTAFAKSKAPLASTTATFPGRSFQPAVVVLYRNFHMGFSCDVHVHPVVYSQHVHPHVLVLGLAKCGRHAFADRRAA